MIEFSESLKSKLAKFPAQFIHGDVNEFNIILGDKDEISIIDFNDMIISYRVVDLANCIGYMNMSQRGDLQVGNLFANTLYF